MNGFSEDLELVPLRTSLLEQIGRCSLAGEQEDFALWQLVSRDDCGFDSRHPRHDDVTNQHVGLKAIQRLDRLLSTKDRARFEAGLIQDDRECIGDYLFIVRDEYPRLRRTRGD